MSRVPLLNEPPLLDVERALRLAEDASALARRPLEARDRREARLAASVIRDAALVALETALDAGDPRVLAAALELAEETTDELDPWESAFVGAAGELLPRAEVIDNAVRECARSSSTGLRASTATALGPRALRALRGEGDAADEEARRIVVALAEDPEPPVRAAAREALAGAAPPAWASLFDRDPLAVRSAADAARLRAPLDRAALALERGVRRELAAFEEAVGALPDELAGPLLDAWIRTPGALSRDHGPTEEELLALLARVEQLESGDDVPEDLEDLLAALSSKQAAPTSVIDGLIDRLLDRWLALDRDGARVEALVARATERRRDSDDGPRIGAALARQPHAVAIGMRVARWMRPRDFGEHLPAIELGRKILEHGWPPDADPTPLFELALGAPLVRAAAEPPSAEDERDLTRSVLFQLALAPRPSLALVLDTLIDALIDGCPGRWSVTAHFLQDRLVEVAHPRLRALAEAWLHEPERSGWALRHLIAGGHDPEQDPPPEAILAAAAADPKLRPAMYWHNALRQGAADALRAQLAEGALPPGEAVELARALLTIDNATLSDAEQDAIRAAREALAQHDPPDLDALSWAATLMPPSVDAWTAEDHSFLERLIDAHGADVAVTVRLALTLEKRGPDAAIAALCERLLPVCDPDERDMVTKALAVCRGERKNIWKGR